MSAKRYTVDSLLMIAIALLVCCLPWAARPLFQQLEGLRPAGASYAELIRRRYPMRLIDPSWLADDLYWSVAETAARSSLMLLFGISLLILRSMLVRERY